RGRCSPPRIAGVGRHTFSISFAWLRNRPEPTRRVTPSLKLSATLRPIISSSVAPGSNLVNAHHVVDVLIPQNTFSARSAAAGRCWIAVALLVVVPGHPELDVRRRERVPALLLLVVEGSASGSDQLGSGEGRNLGRGANEAGPKCCPPSTAWPS